MIQGVTDKMIEAMRLLQADPMTPIQWSTRKALTDRWLIVSRASGGFMPVGGFALTDAGRGVLAVTSAS